MVNLTKKISIIIILSCINVISAQAADGWYTGMDIGQSNFKAKFSQNFSYSENNISEDDSAISYNIFGGYQFNQYIAAEVSYLDLGKYKLSRNTETASVDIAGFTASALWQLPVNEKFKLFVRTGLMIASSEGKAHTDTEDYKQDRNDVILLLGLGAAYAVTPQWEVRAQYTDIGGATVAKATNRSAKLRDDVFNIGVAYHF